MSGYNFTDRVRRVLQLAREQAAALRHEHVGPEHILLGILREGDGVAVAVLRDLGADTDNLEETFRGTLKEGRPTAGASPDLPYTSKAKKVLELAMREAFDLDHAYVGTEHLLLGLLDPQSRPAVTALGDSGVTLEGARAACKRLRPPERRVEPRRGSHTIARWAFLLALIALIVSVGALVLALRAGRP